MEKNSFPLLSGFKKTELAKVDVLFFVSLCALLCALM